MNYRDIINESIALRYQMLDDGDLQKQMKELVSRAVKCLKKGGKILFCGNGGSAADAQHLAAELSGRFAFDRPPLFAEALHVNTSYLTAVANDYSFDEAYARLVRAMGRKGDMLIAISTSGNSANILNAVKAAGDIQMQVAGFTGKTGGKMKNRCPLLIRVPSGNTARIQEAHIMLGHIFCEAVEAAMFSGKKQKKG